MMLQTLINPPNMNWRNMDHSFSGTLAPIHAMPFSASWSRTSLLAKVASWATRF
jgi:hypothetical protein